MSDQDRYSEPRETAGSPPADDESPDRREAQDAAPGGGADNRGPEGGPASGSDALDALGPYLHPGRNNVMAIYILYLAGIVPAFGAIPALIGFVLAVMSRGKSDDTWNSHYDFQVRQGIMALVVAVISFLLLFVLIGFLGFLALAIWWIIRSVVGLLAASRHERIRDPEAYTW